MTSKRIRLDTDLTIKVKYEKPESIIKDERVKKSRRKGGASSQYKGFDNNDKAAKPPPDETTAKPQMECFELQVEKTVIETPEVQEVTETMDEVNDEILTFQVHEEDFKSTEIQDLLTDEDDPEDEIKVNIELSTLEELQEKVSAYETIKKENNLIKSALNKVAKENAKLKSLKSQIDNRSTCAFINELQAKIARDDALAENQSLQKTIHWLSFENQRLNNLLIEKDKEMGDIKLANLDAALAKNEVKIEIEQLKSDLMRVNLERKKLTKILSSEDNVGRAINLVEKEFQRNANLESLNKKMQMKIHSLQGKFNLISQETKVHMYRTTMNKKNDTEHNTRHFCQYVLDTIAK